MIMVLCLSAIPALATDTCDLEDHYIEDEEIIFNGVLLEVRDIDIANVLNMRLGEVEGLIKGLLLKGLIRKHEHSGDVFYRIP